MIDHYTYQECKKNKEILLLKIKNLEHGIKQAEAMIAESQLNESSLKYLRRKVSESRQDLEALYLIKKND